MILGPLLAGCAGLSAVPEASPAGAPPPAQPESPAPPRIASAIKASRPEELMGKGPQGLRALMGAPTLLRRDHGAEVWQYAGKSCVLFAYLYPNAKGEPAVSFLDARSKKSGAVPVPDCLTALTRDKTESPVS